jgi:hypothetical protein
MKHWRTVAMIAFLALAVFAGLGLAQSDRSQTGMMRGGMMMGQMMIQHQEMSQLMNKMKESMAAINNEKDPAKLKALLAEHGALMEQMRGKMMGQGQMMQNMSVRMKDCPMMGNSEKPAPK